MRIEESSVAMNAAHDYVYESEIEAASSFRMILAGASESGSAKENDRNADKVRLAVLLQNLITRMLELISGQKASPATGLEDILKTGQAESDTPATEAPGRRLRLEWTNEVTESIREHERTDFSASGTVRTADGRTLDFTLELGMCRDYSCERTLTQSGSMELRDPLALNFAGNAAELSGQRFEFDLDADGRSELIPGLGGGSAWLAFDVNADGRINDGSELFGTQSGDGFADLARLDTDGNHWIDETDAAYAALSLWQHNDVGKDTLTSLKDGGIGAIYLGSTRTPFALTDADNAKLGYVRASGMYLREDGGAGTVQQVDLAV